MQSLDVLLVDDHPMFRMAISSLLKSQRYINEIRHAENGKEALIALQEMKFDVVLLDVNMPEMDGVSCMKEIAKAYPKLKVIVLTQFGDTKFFHTMLGLGASGYLLKTSDSNMFMTAFETIVFDGQVFVSQEVEQTHKQTEGSSNILSQREYEILMLICQQLSSVQIAEKLSISQHTVKNHRKRMFKKLEIENVTGLIRWAIEHGMTP